MSPSVDELLTAVGPTKPTQVHILDLENLSGSGLLTREAVMHTCREYAECTHASRDDLFLIAAGPQNRTAVYEGWFMGKPVFQFRKGKDGADHALQNLMAQMSGIESFNHIYLASGDGGFAELANEVVERGVPFTVVVGKGKRSNKFNGYPTLNIRKENTNE